MDVILSCIDDFSQVSGLTISPPKSRFFVSPNTDRSIARSLSTMSNFPLTSDLGKYLGVPIIHKRVSKDTYAPLVDKVMQRLASWKGKILSPAGRRTLIQSTTSAIPLHVMQTSLLPSSICNKLDQVNRNFLWGGSADYSHTHLVSWDKICQKKSQGGLGLRKARFNNLAMLAKSGWKLHSRGNSLWCNVMRHKYLHNDEFLLGGNKNASSHTWRSLLKTKTCLKDSIKWLLGDGNKIHLWHDWWVGDRPLIMDILHPLPHDILNMKVKDIIVNGSWDLMSVTFYLSSDKLAEILASPIPAFHHTEDHNFWGFSTNGIFFVSSAYDVISKYHDSGDIHEDDTRWIWHLQCPERIRFFIWLLFHNKLNSNEIRLKKNMVDSADCILCPGVVETTDHLFRSCSFAKQ
ncbi:hypothetical protein REPUB_Repub03eG0162200 [Reevesia pubescens]